MADTHAPPEATPGRTATTPLAVPAAGWKQILLRAWHEAGEDNISLIASGVAFCGVLALVPMLGAIVLSYGLFASPETVTANIRGLFDVLPADAAKLIGEQIANVTKTSDGKKGLGLVIALGIALYGAMKGSGAMVTALNVAYDEKETRGFVKLNLLALAIVASAVVLAILAVVAIGVLGFLETLFPAAPDAVLLLGKVIAYLLLALAAAAAAAALYRFGPDRDAAKWLWLTPGSAFAAIGWLAMTLLFGVYVANFGSYDTTYGSLGAAIVLLTWLNLSAYVLLLGAEINCELERQTVTDTTRGPARAMGRRNAYAADTVAGDADPTPQEADPATAPTPRSRGRLPVLLAGAGLALLRRAPGRAAALLGAAAWLSRDRRVAARS